MRVVLDLLLRSPALPNRHSVVIARPHRHPAAAGKRESREGDGKLIEHLNNVQLLQPPAQVRVRNHPTPPAVGSE
jgi:hypothetical protein